jgi:hypothetical protein
MDGWVTKERRGDTTTHQGTDRINRTVSFLLPEGICLLPSFSPPEPAFVPICADET